MRNVVHFAGKDYRVTDGKLDLSRAHIEDIEEVEGLARVEGLRILFLSHNNISRITGLDDLVELRELYLYDNAIEEISGLDSLVDLEELYIPHNRICKISGLANLAKLRILYLRGNPIPTEDIEAAGGLNRTGHAIDPQGFVRYCQAHREPPSIKNPDAATRVSLPEGAFTTRMRSIMKVSESLTVEQLATALDEDVAYVWKHVFTWAEQFGFSIKNGVTIFKKTPGIEPFIDDLDGQFAEWKAKNDKI